MALFRMDALRVDYCARRLAHQVHDVEQRPWSEDRITLVAVGRLQAEFARLGLDSWLAEPVEPQLLKGQTVAEGELGADFAVLLLDPQGDVEKLAIVQAKRAEKLDTAEWERLVGQCRTMTRGKLGPVGTWVWIYHVGADGLARAFMASELRSVDTRLRIDPTPPVPQEKYREHPTSWLADPQRTSEPRGRELEEWFRNILGCRYGKRSKFRAKRVRDWITQAAPRKLLVVGPASADWVESVREQIAAVGYRESKRRAGRRATRG